MEQPSTSSYDPEQVQGLTSTSTVQKLKFFPGLLTSPTPKEEIHLQPSSTRSYLRPNVVLRIRPRTTRGSLSGWTKSCFLFDDEDGNGTPRSSMVLTDDDFTSSYPVGGVHRTVKSSTKQRIFSASYPLLISGPAKSQALSRKRLPGSRLSVLETLPGVSTPFQYYAPPIPDLELQSPSISSPDDMGSSGEEGPIQTQLALEALDHSELEAESIPPKFHDGFVLPPEEEPVAMDFYGHYRDQATDRLSLHAEYQRLERLSLECWVTNPTFFTGETQDQVNRPYATLEEEIFRYLDEEIMELCEGGLSGQENPCARDPTHSDPFDADYGCHASITSPAFSHDVLLDSRILDFYDGRGLPPTQAFDEDLLALFQGEEPKEDAIELGRDSIGDDCSLRLDLQDLPPGSQWSSPTPCDASLSSPY